MILAVVRFNYASLPKISEKCGIKSAAGHRKMTAMPTQASLRMEERRRFKPEKR
jgi:hypothetical protein